MTFSTAGRSYGKAVGRGSDPHPQPTPDDGDDDDSSEQGWDPGEIL